MIHLDRFLDEVYIVFFKRFVYDSEVDVREKFVKVCEGFD